MKLMEPELERTAKLQMRVELLIKLLESEIPDFLAAVEEAAHFCARTNRIIEATLVLR